MTPRARFAVTYWGAHALLWLLVIPSLTDARAAQWTRLEVFAGAVAFTSAVGLIAVLLARRDR